MLSCCIDSISTEPPETSFRLMVSILPSGSLACHSPARLLRLSKAELALGAHQAETEIARNAIATATALNFIASSCAEASQRAVVKHPGMLPIRRKWEMKFSSLPFYLIYSPDLFTSVSDSFSRALACQAAHADVALDKGLQAGNRVRPAGAVILDGVRIAAQTAVRDPHMRAAARSLKLPAYQGGGLLRPARLPGIREEPRRIEFDDLSAQGEDSALGAVPARGILRSLGRLPFPEIHLAETLFAPPVPELCRIGNGLEDALGRCGNLDLFHHGVLAGATTWICVDHAYAPCLQESRRAPSRPRRLCSCPSTNVFTPASFAPPQARSH